MVRVMNIYTYKTNIGEITIASENGAITTLKRSDSENPASQIPADNASFSLLPSELTNKAATQLEEYLARKRQEFDLPIRPKGTAFQRSVWNALTSIPYGETRSYKQIAQMLGNPNACRAVGLANNKNPIWIIIPCHRVIGSNGSLVGYGGGLEMKEQLILLEKETRR